MEKQKKPRWSTILHTILEWLKKYFSSSFEVQLILAALTIFSFALPGFKDYALYVYEVEKLNPNPQRPSLEMLPVLISCCLFLAAVRLHHSKNIKKRTISSKHERAQFLDNLARLSDTELQENNAELESKFNTLWGFDASMKDILKLVRHSKPNEGLIRLFKTGYTELEPTEMWFREKAFFKLRYGISAFITFCFMPFLIGLTLVASVSEYKNEGLIGMGESGFILTLVALCIFVVSFGVMISDISRLGHARSLIKLNPQNRQNAT
jgi:hypothetical protein